MSKELFSLEKVTPISALKPGARVHIIGVCGVAMAQLALALVDKGFNVSGSDKEFYEPMGGILRRSPVNLCDGFSERHLDETIDLVVIGNAVSYENKEVLEAERLGLRYSLFPRLLYELAIKGKHSVVVSGTHGKSTTSSLLATVLTKVDRQPSYFVGAAVQELTSSFAVGKGDISVVEGDEYDSSFFAKVPKFSFYKPNTWIITSLEYDHADIYPDLASIESAFEATLATLTAEDRVLLGFDCENLRRLYPRWKKQFRCTFLRYGEHADSEILLTSIEQQGFLQRIAIKDRSRTLGQGEQEIAFSLPLPGRYNARNAVAVIACALQRGVSLEELSPALGSFRGLKRRQEIRFHGPQTTLIEDFAHHPTAVKETLLGIRQAFPDKRLVAVFEPRSNTSRRKVFQQQYVEGFRAANKVILCKVQAREIDKKLELLDVAELAAEISSSGVPATALASPQDIFTALCQDLRANDVLVIMSNGSFGGLPKLLEDYLKSAEGHPARAAH